MNTLQKMLKENKTTNYINLSNNNLSSIDHLINLLLEFKNLEELDVSNNPFQNFNAVILNLKKVNSLKSLKISIEKPEEALFVLENLPFLLFLNEMSTKPKETDENEHVSQEMIHNEEYEKEENRNMIIKEGKVDSTQNENNDFFDIDDKEVERMSLDNELENFHNLYSSIEKRLIEERPELNNQYKQQFESILSTEIEYINSLLDPSIPNFVYVNKILMSKQKIYNFFMEVLIKLDSKKSIKSIAMSIIEMKNKTIFEAEDLNCKIMTCFQNSNERKFIIEEEKKGIVDEVYKLNEETVFLRNENSRINIELENYKEMYESIYKEKKKVEDENKKMAENILGYSRIISNNNVNTANHSQTQSQVQNQSQLLNKNNSSTHNLNTNTIMNFQPKQQLHQSSVITSSTGAKILTKKMLIEIIDEIYTSKSNYDKISNENKLPRETMEQYMYTFLNYKYGLKNLIIEWAVSIINGIKTFSSEDPKILLFGKILKNEIEEEFRNTYERLKKTISDLLQHYIKARFPMKKNDDLFEIIDKKIKNNGLLPEEEWKGIIFYLYEENDAKVIEAKIISDNENAYSKGQKQMKQGSISICYNNFLKIILDFQIKCRVSFLKKFTLLFKSYDTDNNGILSENEFLNMILKKSKELSLHIEAYIDKILLKVDPFGNKIINFSDCVTMFSKEMIMINDGNKESLLNILIS